MLLLLQSFYFINYPNKVNLYGERRFFFIMQYIFFLLKDKNRNMMTKNEKSSIVHVTEGIV